MKSTRQSLSEIDRATQKLERYAKLLKLVKDMKDENNSSIELILMEASKKL